MSNATTVELPCSAITMDGEAPLSMNSGMDMLITPPIESKRKSETFGPATPFEDDGEPNSFDDSLSLAVLSLSEEELCGDMCGDMCSDWVDDGSLLLLLAISSLVFFKRSSLDCCHVCLFFFPFPFFFPLDFCRSDAQIPLPAPLPVPLPATLACIGGLPRDIVPVRPVRPMMPLLSDVPSGEVPKDVDRDAALVGVLSNVRTIGEVEGRPTMPPPSIAVSLAVADIVMGEVPGRASTLSLLPSSCP
jgi:hypothetical protein